LRNNREQEAGNPTWRGREPVEILPDKIRVFSTSAAQARMMDLQRFASRPPLTALTARQIFHYSGPIGKHAFAIR
jgi:hypothetical protein